MGWLKSFWALRRQNDRVKWALALFLLGAVFAADAAAQVAGYAALSARPVEYVLTPSATGAKLAVSLQSLERAEGVLCVSRQREYSLAVGEKSLTVTELSEQYLSACYGMDAPGSGFWVSAAAYRDAFGREESPAHAQCQAEERTFAGTFYRASLPKEGPQAVAKGSSRTLSGAAEVRVMFRGTDLSGTRQQTLTELGFSVANQELLLEQDYRAQLLLTRLGYGLCAAALALVAGRALYKEGRREVMSRR